MRKNDSAYQIMTPPTNPKIVRAADPKFEIWSAVTTASSTTPKFDIIAPREAPITPDINIVAMTTPVAKVTRAGTHINKN